jgi:hypothetical protein
MEKAEPRITGTFRVGSTRLGQKLLIDGGVAADDEVETGDVR